MPKHTLRFFSRDGGGGAEQAAAIIMHRGKLRDNLARRAINRRYGSIQHIIIYRRIML
jgi:hypothetical protein